MLTAQIQIATLGAAGVERAARMCLPSMPGLTYLVSIQNPDGESIDIPATLRRPDIHTVMYPDRGISLNRNHALALADADIIFIADDDLDYSAEGIDAVRRYFERHPEVDYVTFRHRGPDNKYFPPVESPLQPREPAGYYLTAFELALRRSSLTPQVRFSEWFGPGAPYFLAGEDIVMLLTLQRLGLRGMYIPVTVAEHHGLTTGHRRATPGVLRAQGGYFRLRYGLVEGFVRLIRDIPSRPATPWDAAWYMLQGFFKKMS